MSIQSFVFESEDEKEMVPFPLLLCRVEYVCLTQTLLGTPREEPHRESWENGLIQVRGIK